MRRVWTIGLLLALGCSPRVEDEGAGIPAQVHWRSIEGADHYRIEAWADEYRLLFREIVSDTTFRVTPTIHRALEPFPSRRWRVVGLRGDEVVGDYDLTLDSDATTTRSGDEE